MRYVSSDMLKHRCILKGLILLEIADESWTTEVVLYPVV